MQWSDIGVIVGVRSHGESSLILHIFTRGHGLSAGLVRRPRSQKQGSIYELGNVVTATWQARLPEHLGRFTCELEHHTTALFFNDYKRLSCISSVSALIKYGFPEGEPHAQSFENLLTLFENLAGEDWIQHYVRWEISFLTDLGFGFDFSKCAVSGVVNGLTHVSPKTGRAVSFEAAQPYIDKLLKLPEFLVSPEPANQNQLTEGLTLTGYFLERHLFLAHNRQVPGARRRFVESVSPRSQGAL